MEIDGVRVITDREPPVKVRTPLPPARALPPPQAAPAPGEDGDAEDAWFTIEAAPRAFDEVRPAPADLRWLWVGVASTAAVATAAAAWWITAR